MSNYDIFADILSRNEGCRRRMILWFLVLRLFTLRESHLHLKCPWTDLIYFTRISFTFCTIWVVSGIISAKLRWGYTLKCVYIRTACWPPTFPLFHVLTRIAIVHLFRLGNDVVDPFNNFKLLAWTSHLAWSQRFDRVSKIWAIRLQESPNSGKIYFAQI